MRKFCFGGAIVRTVFQKMSSLETKWKIQKMFLWFCALPTLRVGRSVTRLTVYRAFSSRKAVLGCEALSSIQEMENKSQLTWISERPKWIAACKPFALSTPWKLISILDRIAMTNLFLITCWSVQHHYAETLQDKNNSSNVATIDASVKRKAPRETETLVNCQPSYWATNT